MIAFAERIWFNVVKLKKIKYNNKGLDNDLTNCSKERRRRGFRDYGYNDCSCNDRSCSRGGSNIYGRNGFQIYS